MEIGICEDKGLLEYMRKSTPPPFLLKTFMLVEDHETDEIVSWNEEGTAFVVWQPAEFSRDLLPTHFKHSNFSSFVRQLNTYGFRKITTNRWEFCNDKFQKGKKEKLCEIRRRKAWSNKNKLSQHATSSAQGEAERAQQRPEFSDDEQRSSSTSSSSGQMSSLVEENKRLKKENGVLSTELSSVKSKCRELLDLVAKYARKNDPEKEDEEDSGQEVCDEYDHRPKLFGVRLEVEGEIMKKRKRAEVSHTARVLLSQACK